jgi:hypothetical protein
LLIQGVEVSPINTIIMIITQDLLAFKEEKWTNYASRENNRGKKSICFNHKNQYRVVDFKGDIFITSDINKAVDQFNYC